MKHLFSLAVLAAALVAADNSGPDNPTAGKLVLHNDKALLQGTWTCVAGEEDGNERKDVPTDLTVTFKGDEVTVSQLPRYTGTFTIDPDKRPPAVDILVKEVGGKSKEKATVLYELKGDTLRVCLLLSSLAAGPTQFNSNDGRILLTFRRAWSATEK
jgi:uncharacterized protein (TIGR03067 family)